MNDVLRPVVLPDELDRGYLGFIMRLNGFRTEKNAAAAIAAHFGLEAKTRMELPCVELLAMVAAKSTEDFVLDHTTLPLRRAITSYHPDLRHGSTERRSLLVNSAMCATRAGWYFCSQCIEEDLGFHRRSYWRRSHQIPGQLWCPKHLIALRYVVADASVLLAPSMATGAAVVPQGLVEEATCNAHVQRFLDIAQGLAEQRQPLNVRLIQPMLYLQNQVRLAASKSDRSELLSDSIAATFPRSWLATLYPTLLDKAYGEPLFQVDAVLTKPTLVSSVWPYMLAAAVLFDTADEALNALMSAGRECGVQGKTRRGRFDCNDDGQLIELLARNESIKSVAKMLGRPTASVNKRAAFLGLVDQPKKGRPTSPVEEIPKSRNTPTRFAVAHSTVSSPWNSRRSRAPTPSTSESV